MKTLASNSIEGKNWHQKLHDRINALSICWRVIIRPYHWKFVLLVILGLASSSLEAITIGLTVPILGGLTSPETLTTNLVAINCAKVLQHFGFSTEKNVLVFSMIALVCVLFFMRSMFILVDRYTSTRNAEVISRITKQRLLTRLLGTQYSILVQKNRGSLLADVTQPGESILIVFVNLGKVVMSVFTISSLFSLMLYLSWWATVAMAGLGVILFYFWKTVFPARAKGAGKLLYELRRKESQVQVDAIDGIKVVKSNTIESEILAQQQRLLNQQMHPLLQLVLLRDGSFLLNESIASVVILSLGIVTFFFPSAGLTFPTLIAIMVSMRRVVPAVTVMTGSFVEIDRSRRGLEIIEELEFSTPQERAGGEPLPASIEEVGLKNASFFYDSAPDRWIFKNLNLNCKKGTVTAIVGSSGAGKSTIANILMGLYDLRDGSVHVNGNELGSFKLSSFRQKVGYISQDVFLFNASIEENITLWYPGISREDLERATQLAQLDDLIKTLPNGYQTVVGDRGVRLSGGQCQRVAIARAILRRPQVLIFDEATSALDNLTEKAIYQAIEKLRSNAVVIVIAHRLSTIKDADHIIVLKDGAIVESGKHEELLAKQESYSQLYSVESSAMAVSE